MRALNCFWIIAGSLTTASIACSGSSPAPGESTAQSSQADSIETTSTVADASALVVPAGRERNDRRTRSPIKHVLVIVGENRSFDHVYATYKPKDHQHVDNLLTKGIVNEDGSPGPNFFGARYVQKSAVDSPPSTYALSPGTKTPYPVLPPALAGGPTQPFVSSLADAQQAEGNALPAAYLPFLITGGTGLTSGTVDTRLPNVSSLPPGPFQLTPGIPYDAYAASPVHRFYQMWQEIDCNPEHATPHDPSGCREDLFPWVETTVGAGANGVAPPDPVTDLTTREGSTAMGFYNVLQGDVPYFKELADDFTLDDNMHQSIQGGTGANHIALGTGDADWYSDGQGNALVPPTLQIENPNPAPASNNWYSQDGYSGGTYSDCSDRTQPGVGPVVDYLHRQHIDPNCDPGHYYLLNNYDPGYFGDGTVDTGEFVIPPSSTRTIGDELLARHISWRYYGEDWNAYVADPDGFAPGNEYCNICNPFQYATSIMANAAVRTTHLKDTDDLYSDLASGFLPAFAIVKPSGLLDGHPASSKLDLFEGFTKKIVDAVRANPALFEETAIFITFDEGGGYYDSGYIQPLDFFGDGTRIPLLTVSPHAEGGHISHLYADHVSILKFVERNWGLGPITRRSRDNYPNPVTREEDPYVPVNSPALSDLWDQFDFAR